ncbi:unnamed protein product [Calypogeia fissa]
MRYGTLPSNLQILTSAGTIILHGALCTVEHGQGASLQEVTWVTVLPLVKFCVAGRPLYDWIHLHLQFSCSARSSVEGKTELQALCAVQGQ